MPISVIALLSLVFFASPLPQSTPQASTPKLSVIPVADARMVNPITATPESQAQAKLRYGMDCAMCHGENGNGKGDPGIISDMSLTMMDLTNPDTLKNRTDGEIFYIIKNGQGKMPAEDRAKPDEIWNLVVYLRAFSKPQ
jgi:mono/diheme cytochrome c family protein